jgi:hypothetical protein
MDPTTAVRTDTLPAIATVIAPGAFASAPYVWLWLSGSPDAREFLLEHDALAVTAILVLSVVSGFAIDSLGSYVEFYCIDQARPDHKEMMDIWWQFLRIAWAREPIGQHYLRRMVVTFKFELNMFVASFSSFLGVGMLGFVGVSKWNVAIPTAAALGIATMFFAKAARDSSEVLADVRAALVKGVGEPPFDKNGNPTRSEPPGASVTK